MIHEDWLRGCWPKLRVDTAQKDIAEGWSLCFLDCRKRSYSRCNQNNDQAWGPSTSKEAGLLCQMEGKGKRNSRQHPNFLGAWLIALISQPVNIKASGMDGNNLRLGLCNRSDAFLATGPRFPKSVLEPEKRNVCGVIKGRPVLISTKHPTLSAPAPRMN